MKLKKVLIKTKISSLAPIEAVSFLLLLEQEKRYSRERDNWSF